jgi:hypothetical protein
MLSSEWKDVLRVALSDEEFHIVHAFVEYTQTGEIDGNALSSQMLSMSPFLLEDLWIFGEKIQANKFCNLINEFLFWKYQGYNLNPSIIRHIYKNTTQASKLRQMVVDRVYFRIPWSSEAKKVCGEEMTHEWDGLVLEGGQFALDVMKNDAKMKDMDNYMNRSGFSWSATLPPLYHYDLDFTETTNTVNPDAPVAGMYRIF